MEPSAVNYANKRTRNPVVLPVTIGAMSMFSYPVKGCDIISNTQETRESTGKGHHLLEDKSNSHGFS